MRPPNDLDPVAKKAWKSLVEDLEAQGTLVATDRKVIELYARTYSLWTSATAQLAKDGLTTGTVDRIYINPVANLVCHTAAQLRVILLDCGLSAKTRKVMPVDNDPIMALMEKNAF